MPLNKKIKIFYSTGGYGLIKDADILKTVLTDLGCEVELRARPVDYREKISLVKKMYLIILYKFNFLFFLKSYLDWKYKNKKMVIIHLESIFPEALRIPARQVLIPNQEWFDVSGVKFLPYIDVAWCKSKLALNIFSEYNVKCELIGFASNFSDDLIRRTVNKKSLFLSRIGNSDLRGVGELVSTWSKHPEWPALTIVTPPSRRVTPAPENIVYMDAFPTNEAYSDFAAAFKFQIFATKTEGFGHAIFEALDAGSVVLVTNSPPMNEWFSSSNTLLMDANYCGHHKLSPLFCVTERGIEEAVDRALTLGEAEIEAYRKNGYSLLREMRGAFLNNIKLHATQLNSK